MESLLPRVPAHGYDLRPYIEHFGEALLASDLCVARSGGSIFEVAAHGRPAILIPYPHATGDHQASNARWMAEAGAAVVLPDDELTPQRLRAEVDALLADPARLAAMAHGVGGAGPPGRGGRRRRRRPGGSRDELGRAQAALHRDRRRRDERPGARRARARRAGDGIGPLGLRLPRAAARGGDRPGHRPRGGEHPRGRRRRGRRVHGHRRRQPRARRGGRTRAARAAPQRAPRGGQRGEAHAGHRRDARQDDDELDGRPRPAADGGGPRRTSSAASCARRAATRPGARGSGSSSRPTSPTARSCGCRPSSRSSRTSSSTTTRPTAPGRRSRPRSASSSPGRDASSSGTAPTPRRSWTAPGSARPRSSAPTTSC